MASHLSSIQTIANKKACKVKGHGNVSDIQRLGHGVENAAAGPYRGLGDGKLPSGLKTRCHAKGIALAIYNLLCNWR